MDYYKSKYTSMPDNLYFDRRMANGEKLSDIFDDTDYRSKCFSEDRERPIKVRVGKLYNYVAKNYILFDNWFVLGDDFEDFDKCAYAYRRYNENGIREGGVLIKRDGSYVTREEFLDIQYGDHNGHGKYAIVRQYNGLLNIVDVDNGTKAEPTGIKADIVIHNFKDLFVIIEGKLSRDDEELIWAYAGDELAKENHLKFNFYNAKTGILSPSLWFDYVDKFMYSNVGSRVEMNNYTIVYLNGKSNFIDKTGHFLSDTWFDVARIIYTGEGIAGVLKSESLKNLPNEIGEDFAFNPEKFDLIQFDRYGKIKTR